MNNFFKKAFLSVGFSGFLPKMPGTWGSFFSAIILGSLYFILPPNIIWRFFILAILYVLIYFLAKRFIKDFLQKENCDPQWIVIDEFLGLGIAFLPFMLNKGLNWWLLIFGFILFRLFDIKKIWLVKRMDDLHSAAGVMLDDVVAGIFAAFIIFAAKIILWLI